MKSSAGDWTVPVLLLIRVIRVIRVMRVIRVIRVMRVMRVMLRNAVQLTSDFLDGASIHLHIRPVALPGLAPAAGDHTLTVSELYFDRSLRAGGEIFYFLNFFIFFILFFIIEFIVFYNLI